MSPVATPSRNRRSPQPSKPISVPAPLETPGRDSLGAVLTEIAETASETLELQAVFDRVANAVRRLIPLDSMGVVRLIGGERAVLHAITLPCFEEVQRARAAGLVVAECQPIECAEGQTLTSWSPRLRPRAGPIPLVSDTLTELDATFPFDRKMVEKGVRSVLWQPFRTAEGLDGGVWLNSQQPRAFTEEHQRMLRPIAALLGSTVEHWRIWDAERRRRVRLERLEGALRTLADTLDVRQVFDRVSEEIRPILDHDLLGLTEFDERTATARVMAVAGELPVPLPSGPVPLSDDESRDRLLDSEILDDIPAQLEPATERNRIYLSLGRRSMLRVPVRLSDEVRGSLFFFHRDPSRYSSPDLEVAMRLADRIALVHSHQRLAEEERVAAEAEERAERLQATVETLARELASRSGGRVVGESASWKDVLLQIGRVAPSETTVLVTGESGTGKEVVANLVHRGSPRAARPLVAINCAALPEQLLESELFGHERGAFTGAVAAKVGRIEQAAGGTLFLDEIAEMSPRVQAKFLRFLQEREFQRLGGTRTLRADVRVIAATNRDLALWIERGDFREDLYYRLNVFEIGVPALRQRSEDILVLAETFLEELGRTMGRPAAGISRDAREWLLAYAWPGNVRELRNAVERAILLCDGGLITREHLPAAVARQGGNGGNGSSGGAVHGPTTIEAMERGMVSKALEEARGNKSRAARLLGLTRAQLYSRLEKYGLLP